MNVNFIRKGVFAGVMCLGGMQSVLGASVVGSLMALEVPTYWAPIFTIDFSTPEIRYTSTCDMRIEGVEFNTTCGKSWKWDKYDREKGQFSFIEFDVELSKHRGDAYALELLACQRKDFPAVSKVSIYVNGKPVAREFSCYYGPDSHYFPNAGGQASHLRWEVFEMTEEMLDGMNTIRIELEEGTESGISISRLHVRPLAR